MAETPEGRSRIPWRRTKRPEAPRRRRLAHAVADWLFVGAFLGAGLGYLAFYSALPSVTVPSTARLDLVVLVGTLFGLGVLGGFLARDVEDIVAQTLAGIGIGVGVDYLITVSPVFREGVVTQDATEFLFMVLRFALPLVLLSFVVWIFAGVVGLYFQELVRRRTPAEDIFPGLREKL